MAATEKRTMWLYKTADNLPAEVKEYPIAASQGVLIPGAPMYISTSGTAKVCDTSDGSDAWHGFLVGLADPVGTWPISTELAANTKVRIQLIDTDDTYAAYCSTSTSDSAAAQSIVGTSYGLRVETGTGIIGYTTVSLSDSTNDTVKVVDVMGNLDTKNSQFDLTTSPGVALVKFLSAVVTADKA